MKKRGIWKVTELAKESKNVAIIGMGGNGKRIAEHLLQHGVSATYLFDNNPSLKGKEEYGVKISIPRKIEGKALYIISPEEPYREELYNQMSDLGVKDEELVACCFNEYEYRKDLPEEDYKEEISHMFREAHGYDMDWDNPKTYSEIVNWEKLYDRNPLKTRLADKYAAREWVKNNIGGGYVTKLLGVWDDPKDIDFDKLPKKFVLKVNRGSGCNIIVTDKDNISVPDIVKKLKTWMDTNYAFYSFEWQYKDIVPKIICEEYIEGLGDNAEKKSEKPYDFKIYCFKGEPKYIECIRGSKANDGQASFYTTDWRVLPLSYGYAKDDLVIDRPSNLEEMLNISRKLSEPFKHVRVDLYNLPDGRVLFGELTFSSWSGLRRFNPVKYDRIFGELIRS